MAESAKKGVKEGTFMTPVFRVSFPQVFQARAVMPGQDPKFSIAMLFPKVFTDLTEKQRFEAMKAAVTAAAVAKWGADKTKWPKPMNSPWHDGTEKDYDGYGPDVVYASASSKIRPGLVDSQLSPIIAPSEFYGGCYARATITVFAYENLKKGVSFGLRNIQKVRDGEPFSGASKPEDDFDAIPDPGAGATPAQVSIARAATAAKAESDPLGI